MFRRRSYLCKRYCLIQFVENPSRAAIVRCSALECEGPMQFPVALCTFRPQNDIEWNRERIYHVFQPEQEELILEGWKPVYVRDVAETEEELVVGLEKLLAQNHAAPS